MTQEVLDRLKKLQEVLSQKYVLETELREIPKSLNTKTEVVSRLKKLYIEKNEQYDQTKEKIAEYRQKIEEAEKDRESSEALIVDISTQREYEALLKQIKEAGEREQQFRRDLQREEKVFEEMGQNLLRDEATIQQQEGELKQEQERITQATDAKSKSLNKLVHEESNLTGDQLLSKEILFKFERIIMKKEGKGIVPLRKGVCTGCNMILPLQFVNEVRSNLDDQPHFCPYCSMILYHEDTEEGYFDFVYEEALSSREDDDDETDYEEVDEGRLMEAEMNEGYHDDEDEVEGEEAEEEEDELVDEEDLEEEDSDALVEDEPIEDEDVTETEDDEIGDEEEIGEEED